MSAAGDGIVARKKPENAISIVTLRKMRVIQITAKLLPQPQDGSKVILRIQILRRTLMSQAAGSLRCLQSRWFLFTPLTPITELAWSKIQFASKKAGKIVLVFEAGLRSNLLDG